MFDTVLFRQIMLIVFLTYDFPQKCCVRPAVIAASELNSVKQVFVKENSNVTGHTEMHP